MNTLHFGSKAKNVKTKVNVNEISQLISSTNTSSSNFDNSIELDRANSLIVELRDRLKFLEHPTTR